VSIASLERRIYNCPYTNSDECNGRLNCHPIAGYGSTHPKFLVLGTNPALRNEGWRFCKSQKELQIKYYEECMRTGRFGYGVLLTKLRDQIPDFDIPENVYLSDIVKCPTKFGHPSPKMIKKCRTAYLQNTIELLKPKIIIAFGQTAAIQLQHIQNPSFHTIAVDHPSRVPDVDRVFAEINHKLEQIENLTVPSKEVKNKPAEFLIEEAPTQLLDESTSKPFSKNTFEEALNLWINRKDDERPTLSSPTYHFFTNTLERYVQKMVQKVGFSGLIVKVSAGKGNWAEIPWVGIRNDDITTNFQQGLFVVFVFAPQFRKLYLTLIMGVEKETIGEIEMKVSALRKKVRMPEGFSIGMEGNLASNTPFNSKPDRYKRGILYSRKYDVRQMIDSEVECRLERRFRFLSELRSTSNP
jgi:hypothetical protein